MPAGLSGSDSPRLLRRWYPPRPACFCFLGSSHTRPYQASFLRSRSRKVTRIQAAASSADATRRPAPCAAGGLGFCGYATSTVRLQCPPSWITRSHCSFGETRVSRPSFSSRTACMRCSRSFWSSLISVDPGLNRLERGGARRPPHARSGRSPLHARAGHHGHDVRSFVVRSEQMMACWVRLVSRRS
jgi:hypothetical protein